jgi:hypothetical protein
VKLNSENVQLKEELSNVRQRNEAERVDLLKQLDRLQHDAAATERRVEAKQKALMLERKAIVRIPPGYMSDVGSPQKCEMFL